MSVRSAELLLIFVIASRGTSFMFSKLLLTEMGPFTLMGLRFTIAFLVLGILFNKKLRQANRQTLLSGLLIGTAFFFVMSFELSGLSGTTSSKAALIENTAIVFVPIYMALGNHHLPKKQTMFTALAVLTGVACLVVRGGEFSLSHGDYLIILAALTYAGTIILIAKFSKEGDSTTIGIIQLGVIGFLGLTSAFLMEQPTLPSSETQWGYLLMLAFVCSGFGFTLQPVAQRHLSAERAGLFCAFNPMVASLMGLVFLHEEITPLGIFGMGLILASILLSNVSPHTLTHHLPHRHAHRVKHSV